MANTEVIRDLFKNKNLGDVSIAKKLEGGLRHETWYVKTENKEHVIKIYNPNCSPDGGYEQYDYAEKVAHLIKAKGNDNVICAQMTGKTSIQYYHKRAFSLYEYIEGMHLLHAQIEDYHIKKIATFLAQIHSIKAPIGMYASQRL